VSADVGLEPLGRDPAVETWRETFAVMDRATTDPGVLAVAADARCLLLALPGMPLSERGAFAEELAAAEPGDVPGLLRSWRVIAGLHAASAGAQNGPQSLRDGLPALADPGGVNGAPRTTQETARAIPGRSATPGAAHSPAEASTAPVVPRRPLSPVQGATGPSVALHATSEAHTDREDS